MQKALSKIEGVRKATVSRERAEAVVAFDEGRTSAESLIAAVRDAGFTARIEELRS